MDKNNEKMNVEVFDYSTIPKFMKDHGRFCLWKLVMKPDKTKPDKIPYQLNGKRVLFGSFDASHNVPKLTTQLPLNDCSHGLLLRFRLCHILMKKVDRF